MKKVWAVEQGCYSDYHVVGVFSSREAAQLVADAINKPEEDKYVGEDATVTVWTIDPAVEALRAGLRPHIVNMLRDGTVERCDPWTVSGYNIGGELSIWRRSQAPAYRGQGIKDCINATVWASDTEHAVKIVNEKRAQMIASGEWK